MAKTVAENNITRVDIKNIDDLKSVLVDRKFGRPEDFVEVHIYDLNNNLLNSVYEYTDFNTGENIGGLTNEININPQQILNENGYNTGEYRLKTNIQKRKIFNSITPVFRISEISATRNELKLSTTQGNTVLDSNSRNYIQTIQNSTYLREFILNFQNDINVVGVNMDIDKSNPNEFLLLIKLLKPLPDNISVGDKLNIVEDIVDPLEIIYNLGELPPVDTTTPIKGPNFKIDIRLNPKVSNEFKSFNDILSTSTTSSYQRLLSKLNGYEIPEIDYGYIRPVDTGSLDFLTVTPTHFENFVHFGSATELLNNFKYKLELIELYNTQLGDLETITGTTLQSAVYTNASTSIKLKKENLIQGFSGYEQFLYFESGAYSWPKINSIEPYILAHTTSSEAETWLGSGDSYNSNYGGQLLSASVFDSQNPNKLSKLIPTFIGDKEENQPYMLFCDMIGQHFDPIWTHIREITQLRDNSHTLGVSKDLVYYTLKTLGIEGYDQFENDDLIEYVFGSNLNPQDTSTVITASNAIVSKQDISKEVWKRLYHNAPYLLKTKGTERGLRALINCYGIPETVLDIKEFGSSDPNRDEFKLYSYPKFTQVLSGNSITNGDVKGMFIETEWSSSLTNALSSSAKTIEFRIKPNRTDDNYHLFSLTNHSSHTDISGSDLHLTLHPYTGDTDFFIEGDKNQYGKLILTQFTSSIAETEGVVSLGPERVTNGKFTTPGIIKNTTFDLGFFSALEENSDSSITENGLLNITNPAGLASGIPLDGRVFLSNGIGNNILSSEDVGKTFILQYTVATNPEKSPIEFFDGTSFVDVSLNEEGYEFTYLNADSLIFRTALDDSTVGLAEISIREKITTSYFKSDEYFPIYNGSFWNIFISTDGISGSDSTIKFGAYQANHLREINYYTGSAVISEENNAKSFGNPYYDGANYIGGVHKGFLGGIKDITSNGIVTQSFYTTGSNSLQVGKDLTVDPFPLGYNGALSEVRYYFGESLNHNTLKKHALEPLMYGGNSISSSYNNLVLRYPLSFELDLTTNVSSQIPSGSNGSTLGGGGATWNANPTTTGLISPSSNLVGPITGGAILSSSLNVNQTSSGLAPSSSNNLGASINQNGAGTGTVVYSGQYFPSGSVPLGSAGAPIFTVAGTPLLQSHHPDVNTNYLDGFTYFNQNDVELLVEDHHLPTPNTIGKSPVNRKIYIDSGSTDDNILSPDILSQLPITERQVPDFSNVGIYLSPQNELTEDIIYTLGTFSLDEFLGDPRESKDEFYTKYKELQIHYFKKLKKGEDRYNIRDFTRWIQYLDYTLFELIKQFTPQKSIDKTGLLIEPHILERSKFKRYNPIQSDARANMVSSSVYDTIIQEITASFNKNNNYSQLNNTTGSAKINELRPTIDVAKALSGSSTWEQGPLVPNSTGSVKQRNSSGSNALRSHVLTPYGNFMNSVLSKKKFSSGSNRNIQFDDSLLEMETWKRSRYEGSKLTATKINEYNVGDITYGLNPVLSQNATALYFGKSIIGADGEDNSLTTIKNHSYIDVEKIIIINKYKDTVTAIDVNNEKFKGINGYLAKDFKDGSSFNIKLLDNKTTHKLKKSYTSKFNQGYFYKVLEHKGMNGSGSVSGQGIQVGYARSSSVAFPTIYSSSAAPFQNIFVYAKHDNIINNDTVKLYENTLTKKIWPDNLSFGRVDFITSSVDNFTYSSVKNLTSFVNSMLIPVASESQFRLFGTFNNGQPLNVADYSAKADAGIKNISTVEFNIQSGSYLITGSTDTHLGISSSATMRGFGKPLTQPRFAVIPIMQGPHDSITTQKANSEITWPGVGSAIGNSINGGDQIKVNYYFNGPSHLNAIYQISYLEEKQVIISNIDKPTELANGIGEKGYILIPDNLDKDIKKNLDFFLERAGIIEGKTAERIPNSKE